MDIGSIFLLLALLILVVFFVAQPFLNRQKAGARPVGEAKQQLSLLRADRARVVQSLQELDFDYALGKVPEEDLVHELRKRAVCVHIAMESGADDVSLYLRKAADEIERLHECLKEARAAAKAFLRELGREA